MQLCKCLEKGAKDMDSLRDEEEGERQYVVLVNTEEQYSLWLSQRSVPAGWRQVCGPASKKTCLDYVGENWKDLTPLSARRPLSAT
jgi:MbtH protein